MCSPNLPIVILSSVSAVIIISEHCLLTISFQVSLLSLSYFNKLTHFLEINTLTLQPLFHQICEFCELLQFFCKNTQV